MKYAGIGMITFTYEGKTPEADPLGQCVDPSMPQWKILV